MGRANELAMEPDHNGALFPGLSENVETMVVILTMDDEALVSMMQMSTNDKEAEISSVFSVKYFFIESPILLVLAPAHCIFMAVEMSVK